MGCCLDGLPKGQDRPHLYSDELLVSLLHYTSPGESLWTFILEWKVCKDGKSKERRVSSLLNFSSALPNFCYICSYGNVLSLPWGSNSIQQWGVYWYAPLLAHLGDHQLFCLFLRRHLEYCFYHKRVHYLWLLDDLPSHYFHTHFLWNSGVHEFHGSFRSDASIRWDINYLHLH